MVDRITVAAVEVTLEMKENDPAYSFSCPHSFSPKHTMSMKSSNNLITQAKRNCNSKSLILISDIWMQTAAHTLCIIKIPQTTSIVCGRTRAANALYEALAPQLQVTTDTWM